MGRVCCLERTAKQWRRPATPRRGVVLSGLQVVFQERRAEGWGLRAAAPLDALNSARLAVPGLVGELGQQIVCPVRGLLHDDPPGHFFRSVSVRAEHTVGQRASQPLPRGQQAVPRPYLTTIRKAAPLPTSSDLPIQRLVRLQQRREDRFGRLRPLSSPGAIEDIQIFENDREGAVQFIRGEVARVRSKIVFVDPYFDAVDFLDFAYAIQTEGVSVAVLINSRPGHLRQPPSNAPAGIATNGEWIERQIADMQDPKLHFGDIQVRVCGNRRFHDRFVQIDDVLWHCGHSFNSVAGGEISVMSRMPRPQALIKLIGDVFDAAEPFKRYWTQAGQPASSEAEVELDAIESIGPNPDML
jgi:hypothetical protein